MAATASSINLHEYLRTTYRPDVEYIEGELKEKPVPTLLHSILQVILGSWFFSRRKEWNILVASEVRTQVDESHVRLPDLVVLRKVELTLRALVDPPLVAIEILSPTDMYADLRERATDLRSMGVQNIWLLDPVKRTAELWTGRSWQPAEGNRLHAVDTPIFLDLDWLWAELDLQ